MNHRKLKLVEPVVEDTLAGYEPLLLSTVELLDLYWPQAAELLQRCVDDDGTMHGEITLNDIYEGIKAGTMYALIVKNDEGELPDVAIALVLETIIYPRRTVLNITAIGGRQLDLLESKFWRHVCSWAFLNGVRTIQASVSPAMARILAKYGFNQTYITMRVDLTEM